MVASSFASEDPDRTDLLPRDGSPGRGCHSHRDQYYDRDSEPDLNHHNHDTNNKLMKSTRCTVANTSNLLNESFNLSTTVSGLPKAKSTNTILNEISQIDNKNNNNWNNLNSPFVTPSTTTGLDVQIPPATTTTTRLEDSAFKRLTFLIHRLSGRTMLRIDVSHTIELYAFNCVGMLKDRLSAKFKNAYIMAQEKSELAQQQANELFTASSINLYYKGIEIGGRFDSWELDPSSSLSIQRPPIVVDCLLTKCDDSFLLGTTEVESQNLNLFFRTESRGSDSSIFLNTPINFSPSGTTLTGSTSTRTCYCTTTSSRLSANNFNNNEPGATTFIPNILDAKASFSSFLTDPSDSTDAAKVFSNGFGDLHRATLEGFDSNAFNNNIESFPKYECLLDTQAKLDPSSEPTIREMLEKVNENLKACSPQDPAEVERKKREEEERKKKLEEERKSENSERESKQNNSPSSRFRLNLSSRSRSSDLGPGISFPPELTDEGTGGTYKMHSQSGDIVGYFKPKCEEVFAPNNPRGREGPKEGGPGVRPGIYSGQQACREVAAFLLDSEFRICQVPITVMARSRHPVYNINTGTVECQGPLSSNRNSTPQLNKSNSLTDAILNLPWKLGSFQKTVDAKECLGDYSSCMFDADEIHRLGILDIRILNMDRNEGNVLVDIGRRTQADRGKFEEAEQEFNIEDAEKDGSIFKTSSIGSPNNLSPMSIMRMAPSSFCHQRELMNTIHSPRFIASDHLQLPRTQSDISSSNSSSSNLFPTNSCTSALNFDLNESDSDFIADIASKLPASRLIPIDHGLSLPDRLNLEMDEVCWMSFPQAKLPFSPLLKAYIERLNAVHDRQTLSASCGMSSDALRLQQVATILLKVGAREGLTLYEIGTMLYKKSVADCSFDKLNTTKSAKFGAVTSAVNLSNLSSSTKPCPLEKCVSKALGASLQYQLQRQRKKRALAKTNPQDQTPSTSPLTSPRNSPGTTLSPVVNSPGTTLARRLSPVVESGDANPFYFTGMNFSPDLNDGLIYMSSLRFNEHAGTAVTQYYPRSDSTATDEKENYTLAVTPKSERDASPKTINYKIISESTPTFGPKKSGDMEVLRLRSLSDSSKSSDVNDIGAVAANPLKQLPKAHSLTSIGRSMSEDGILSSHRKPHNNNNNIDSSMSPVVTAVVTKGVKLPTEPINTDSNKLVLVTSGSEITESGSAIASDNSPAVTESDRSTRSDLTNTNLLDHTDNFDLQQKTPTQQNPTLHSRTTIRSRHHRAAAEECPGLFALLAQEYGTNGTIDWTDELEQCFLAYVADAIRLHMLTCMKSKFHGEVPGGRDFSDLSSQGPDPGY